MNAKHKVPSIIVIVAIIAVTGVFFNSRFASDEKIADKILNACERNESQGTLDILQPLDGTVYPRDLAPPVFMWKSSDNADVWMLHISGDAAGEEITFLCDSTRWRPDADQWRRIKSIAGDSSARLLVAGALRDDPENPLASTSVTFSVSEHSVEAPIFYREVNLPFREAVKDPSKIRWRFGSVSSGERPHVVLKELPVCGNCHSFSADGTLLGMDVDYANSKGSYAIVETAKQMVLTNDKIITWDDYRKEDGKQTFGLLSRVSPSGRYAVSTVKDRSVFVATEPLAFSQLFFPIKGILAFYDRETDTFQSLSGADDPEYVQSNPVWSPDGKYIVFARTRARQIKTSDESRVLLTPEEVRRFLDEEKDFKYNLYKIPFNNGEGGEPEPLAGASHNGKSNYFPKFSPDGKWIVFCKAENYMLLQSDSELYVIPADGGEARRLRCNTMRMNSWHSFSPNGKWLVFSSKAYSDYTQLCMTYFDEQGRTTPPVLLDWFTATNRAANIPEFVRLQSGSIVQIREEFMDDVSFVRAGDQFYRGGDPNGAIENYRKALELNPDNVRAHVKLGFLLYNVKNKPEQGKEHCRRALELEADNVFALYDLGHAMLVEGDVNKAVTLLEKAVALAPEGLNMQYSAERMHHSLARAYLARDENKKASAHLRVALEHAPKNPKYHYDLAVALSMTGNIDEAIAHYTKAVTSDASVDKSPVLHKHLAETFAVRQRFSEAIKHAQKAITMARTLGKTELEYQVMDQLEQYRLAVMQMQMSGN
ncbi:MAG: tetratricopeptide repeat protein [Verrucomicrobia bacterium]|nr:tetratricopeptide repeat protein [Verrucomicrobiota bacterium]